MRRFPAQTIPEGWYQVGWSSEYPVGAVKRLHYFEHDLVAFRNEHGALCVFDAYCPHMGAHLGVGGVVAGSGIRCPFHGWRFDDEGRNVEVPYSEPKVMGNLRARTWEVRELHGLVLVWYHPARDLPRWEPDPWVPDDTAVWDPYPDATATWERQTLAAQPVVENVADAAHFAYVHTAAHVPSVKEFAVEEHTFSMVLDYPYGLGHESTWATPDGPVQGTLEARCQGLGFIWSRMHGYDDIFHCLAVAPINAEMADVRATVFVPKRRGDGTTMPADIFRKWVRQHHAQSAADVQIWANLSFTERPPYAKSEAQAMRAFKRWAKQFYCDTPAGV